MGSTREVSEEAVGGVLCAGYGSRMAPITDVIPKPLIPFLNTPFLAYTLDHLRAMGVQNIAINLHHLAELVPPVADPLCRVMGLTVRYAREWEILGTAGGARGIWQALGEPSKTLVLMNGDSIMNIDLARHFEAHKASGARATMVLRPREKDQPGKVWVKDGQLLGLRDFRHPAAEDGMEEYDFTGVYFLEPELLAEIPLEKGCMVGDILGPRLSDGEAIHGSINHDFWAALDTPELYFSTTCRVLENREIFRQVPLPNPLGDGLFVFHEAGVDGKAKLAGPLLTGAHVKVSAGAYIGPHVVLDGVEVSTGAKVRNAVLYGMGAVEGEWENCLAIAGKVVTLKSSLILDDSP